MSDRHRWPPAPERLEPVDESDPNTFVMTRLRYQTLTNVIDQWDAFPQADENLLNYLRRVTNIKVSNKTWQERAVGIEQLEKVFDNPFVFMTGEGDFRLSSEEAVNFAEYFARGGFLYADDCVKGMRTDYFYQAFSREFRKVFPVATMQPVPFEHPIYHCFYDFPEGAPFYKGAPHRDLGLFLDDRLVAFLTAGDLHCNWAGNNPNPNDEKSFQMGVNIIVYSLTH
ncbi:DUF4159 domain-containing protein [Candidatus Sumerlaeota bacterium]|nr:DUF4159 domain-containing protein [Candidatus Sumerlaeota bacterium]